MKLRPLCLCLAILLTAAPAFSDQPWTEVRSPHFRVLTDGSASNARHVAREFEQMRYVFATQFPGFRLESGAPLTIFAARDEQTAKRLDPLTWKHTHGYLIGAGSFGRDRQYAMIVVHLPVPYVGFTPASMYAQSMLATYPAYSAYIRFILRMNIHWLPQWLWTGLTDFYAYTRFEQDKIYLGSPMPDYVRLVRSPLPVETIISDWDKTPEYKNPNLTPLFPAESWALVHYLNLGPGMGHGAKLNQFINLIEAGTPQKEAFQRVFGSFAQVDKALNPYMRAFSFTSALVKNAPTFDEKTFTVKTLSLAETYAELAGYRLWRRDIQGAQLLVDKAIQENPHLGFAHELQGFLYFQNGNDTSAENEFSQAYALDPALYLSLFAKTMLSPAAAMKTPADMESFNTAMMKVADLNMQFAPAYVQLARVSVAQNNLTRAYTLSRRAEELEPWRAGYHLLTGQILLRMGKDAEAAKYAQYVAKRWHGTDRVEAVELWNSIPAQQRPAGIAVMEEIKQGAKAVRGTVQSIECMKNKSGTPKPDLLALSRDGHLIKFRMTHKYVIGYPDTLWWGSDEFSVCHNLGGLRAVVHYLPLSGGSPYVGDVAQLSILDTLPKPDAAAPKKTNVAPAQ